METETAPALVVVVGITCPQHNVITCALFEIFIFVTGRLGVVGKVGYWQLYGLRPSSGKAGFIVAAKTTTKHTHSSTCRLIRLIFQDGIFFPHSSPYPTFLP